MRILGIESTCDETGAAVVERTPNGLRILSNVLASSVDLQKKYGGVVPEVAAREQVRVIVPVIEEALSKASEVGSWKWEGRNRSGKLDSKKSHIPTQNLHSHISHLISNLDAIAVSYGPGLIGSLLIGVETAKVLALVWDKPLIPVNHLVGHIYANFVGKKLETRNSKLEKVFPAMCLIVSGGHTDLVLMKGHGKFKLIGATLDDSAGEAFDKVARVLGLGYPGGPEVERLASQIQNPKSEIQNLKLPRPMIKSGDFDFSFSGLKTAVVNLVERHLLRGVQKTTKAHPGGEYKWSYNLKIAIADEFQRAVVDVLVHKTIKASQKNNCKSIVMGGGVVANTLLRSQMTDSASRLDIRVYFPSKNLAVDNGAMIAAAAFFVGKKIDPLKLQVNHSLHF